MVQATVWNKNNYETLRSVYSTRRKQRQNGHRQLFINKNTSFVLQRGRSLHVCTVHQWQSNTLLSN